MAKATTQAYDTNRIHDKKLRTFIQALQRHGFAEIDNDFIGGFTFRDMSGSLAGLQAAMKEAGWVRQGPKLFPSFDEDEGWQYFVMPKRAAESDPMVAVCPVYGNIYVS